MGDRKEPSLSISWGRGFGKTEQLPQRLRYGDEGGYF